ncbi:CDP-diacylglycerol--serine O-phosphatidyltransferase [Jannaschia sp. Os4]|uniref:CDP-diacylglycerol--serine O-phosphatidyltransferase n=1 Tax=Jannaschia sp. Os4 TaxID=2807617 RepID=UPI00193978A4|nr:CDP-diacylglycerol--serine O-phosphatidyltransferase [Jannaschia sp. Os4]MBM2577417.1 CDP-diacylglycerol--serine O-phosphatidyltransferase [Jannaschia sp. Os4]
MAEPRRFALTALLPNLVTILGLCTGLTAVRFAFDGQMRTAAVLLVVAALLDATDGALARKLDAASPFGAELDSLSDFVCFGVAPALLVYAFALSDVYGLGWVAALFFAICCCLRLARFNVAAKDPDVQGDGSFQGVPAPAGAMLCLFPVFLDHADVVDLREVPLVIALWVLFVGGLMVASFRTVSLKSMRVSRENAIWVLLAAAVVIGLMLTRLWLFCVLASVLYMALLAWGAVKGRRRPQAEP